MNPPKAQGAKIGRFSSLKTRYLELGEVIRSPRFKIKPRLEAKVQDQFG